MGLSTGGKKFVIPLEGGKLTISLNSDLVHASTNKDNDSEDEEEGSSKRFDADMYEQLNRLHWEEDAKKRILDKKDNSRDNFNTAAADIEKYVKFLKSAEELNEPGIFGAVNSYGNNLGKDKRMNAKIKRAEVEVETFEPIANRNEEIRPAEHIAARVPKESIGTREYEAIKANRNLKNLVQRETVRLPEFETFLSDEDVRPPPPPPISRSSRHENEVLRSKGVERRANEPAIPQTSVRRPASKTVISSGRKVASNGGVLHQAGPILKTCSMPDRLETAQSRQMLHKPENYCESAPAQPEYVRPHREEDKNQDQLDGNQHFEIARKIHEQLVVVPESIDVRPGSDEVFRQLKRIKKNIFVRCRVNPKDSRAVMVHISWHFPCNLIGSRVVREWIPKNSRSRLDSLPSINCNLDGAPFQLNGIKRKWDILIYPYMESADDAYSFTAYELPSSRHTPDYAVERIQLGRKFVRDHVVAIDTDREVIQLVNDVGHAIWLPYQIRNKSRGDSWPV